MLGASRRSVATTPGSDSTAASVGRGATGDLLGDLLRRRRPDARPPHLPGAPGARHHLATCCSRVPWTTGRTSVYTGLIRIQHEGRGTNAFQTNRNLKLSDDAWAESVPNLEIETNDVHCCHASTVGPIDEDQRFYLESRGVPPAAAERLIVAGFFDEVLDALPVPQLAPRCAARIADLLDRQVGAGAFGAAAEDAGATAGPDDRDPHPTLCARRPRRRRGPTLRRRRPAARRGAHRRRRLRHRRPLQPRATSRCPRARSTPTTARSSARSTAALFDLRDRRAADPAGRSSRCPTYEASVVDGDVRGGSAEPDERAGDR